MVDSSQAYDHHTENDRIHSMGAQLEGQTTTDTQLPPMEPAQELPKVKQAPTKYVVYSSSDDGATLAYVTAVNASSDVAALKRAVPDPVPTVKYAAIPQRSFRLRGGTSEAKPVVKFS